MQPLKLERLLLWMTWSSPAEFLVTLCASLHLPPAALKPSLHLLGMAAFFRHGRIPKCLTTFGNYSLSSSTPVGIDHLAFASGIANNEHGRDESSCTRKRPIMRFWNTGGCRAACRCRACNRA